MPASALAAEVLQRFGRIGPADGVRYETDVIAPPLLLHHAVDANDELHVLADRLRIESADFDERRAAEYAEGAGNDEDGSERLPAHAAEKERAQILDDLHERERIARQGHLLEEALAQLASVGDPDRAARSDRLGILEKRPDCARQRVALQHAVRIDDRDQRIAADVDAGVAGVGLVAAVLLADHS